MDVRRKVSEIISSLINQLIANSPDIQKQMTPLVDKVVCIHVSGMKHSFYFVFEENGINFLFTENAVSDLMLSATPAVYIRKLLTLDKNAISDDLKIEGDVGLAQKLNSFLIELELDWEELLSKYVGDIIAHQVGVSARQTLEYGQARVSALQNNIKEYLQEEAKLLPTRVEVEQFNSAVDKLRAGVDRLSAKVFQLEKELGCNSID